MQFIWPFTRFCRVNLCWHKFCSCKIIVFVMSEDRLFAACDSSLKWCWLDMLKTIQDKQLSKTVPNYDVYQVSQTLDNIDLFIPFLQLTAPLFSGLVNTQDSAFNIQYSNNTTVFSLARVTICTILTPPTTVCTNKHLQYSTSPCVSKCNVWPRDKH